ncbi:MAG: hypothetical protein R6V10_03730 [bacterium]
MKERDSIKALVCRPHCRFYRPGEKEELSCYAYDFISERLGDKRAAELAGLFDGEVPPERFEPDPRLEARLCSHCEFRAEDCDFMSGEDLPDAVPCGGYVCWVRLLEEGVPEAREWLNEE